MEDLIVTRKATPTTNSTAFDELVKRAGVNVQTLYDKLTWLWYAFDVSGSMSSHINADSGVTFQWTPALVTTARQALKTVQKQADPSDLIQDFNPDDDEEVKAAVEEGYLITVNVPMTKHQAAVSNMTKLQMSKKAARNFVAQRFAKYPDAKVGVISFQHFAEVLACMVDETATLAAIDGAYGDGGTDIYNAVSAVLKQCEKSRSVVPHHAVVVTDGLDGSVVDLMAHDGPGSAYNRPELLSAAKKNNVVFDVIFILADGDKESGAADHRVLERFCRATGGSVEYVDNAQSFERKLLAVSNRKLLAAWGGK